MAEGVPMQGSQATYVDSHSEEEDSKPEGVERESTSEASGSDAKKRIFSKELRCMMYGFGDDQNPYAESVELLEDLVLDFITQITLKAIEIGRPGRVQVEDIIFLIRKDARKYSRVRELLMMNEELKKARKAFDEAIY
ncbi:transcription initiation factor TFIID subunit 13-like [Amphiura filiformis]|uniref:transcription initiation factor TFIID subunit 13-like n=1 Tax=Amphiura filiformis TaxID=82378 RepID=UPI003B225C33